MKLKKKTQLSFCIPALTPYNLVNPKVRLNCTHKSAIQHTNAQRGFHLRNFTWVTMTRPDDLVLITLATIKRGEV